MYCTENSTLTVVTVLTHIIITSVRGHTDGLQQFSWSNQECSCSYYVLAYIASSFVVHLVCLRNKMNLLSSFMHGNNEIKLLSNKENITYLHVAIYMIIARVLFIIIAHLFPKDRRQTQFHINYTDTLSYCKF